MASCRSCFCRCLSPAGVGALVFLPLAVWVCARFWWFNVGQTELGDLSWFCRVMPPLLAVTAACFCFFMLPPWRARQRGAGVWIRRAVAFALTAAGAFAAHLLTCCCTVGYDGWIDPVLALSLVAVWVCLITSCILALRRG